MIPDIGVEVPSLVLVGLPGCGKTSVGRHLADLLGMPFVDLDAAIVARIGCSIPEFFVRVGEAEFRRAEAEAFVELAGASPAVIATGGGAVGSAESRQIMRNACRTVYMHCSPELIVPRVRRDKSRPLFFDVDIETKVRDLYTLRDPLYREAAGLVVDVRGSSASATAHEVLRALRKANWVPAQLPHA